MEQIQDALVSRARSVDGVPTSLFDLGYTDVGLDDAWQRQDSGPHGVGYHDADGNPIINTEKFPDMGAMVARGHGLNLTVGWYGNNCISKDPSANISHFLGDVAAFRRLDFDSYKLDSCGGQKDIALWANLLNTSGRAVVTENCHNGPYFPEPAYKPDAPPYCPFNFYRTSVDVEVLYASIMAINLQQTVPFLANSLSYRGCWAYGDMLEVGVSPGLHKGEVALTFPEARAHFGAWAIVSSPLVLGLDVRDDAVMDAVWPIISNKEAIAVNQAYAGSSGTRIAFSSTNVTFPFCGSQYSTGCAAPSWEVFSKPLPGSDLPNGSAALLVLNHGTTAVDVTVDFSDVPTLVCGTRGCAVRDVWNHSDAGTVLTSWTVTQLASHDSAFVTLTPL